MGTGDSFGEIALLRRIPRTATVTAISRVEAGTLAREEFLAAVTGNPESAEEVVSTRLQAWLTRPAAAAYLGPAGGAEATCRFRHHCRRCGRVGRGCVSGLSAGLSAGLCPGGDPVSRPRGSSLGEASGVVAGSLSCGITFISAVAVSCQAGGPALPLPGGIDYRQRAGPAVQPSVTWRTGLLSAC